jgi:glycopeptide antibiotics resistance protein
VWVWGVRNFCRFAFTLYIIISLLMLSSLFSSHARLRWRILFDRFTRLHWLSSYLNIYTTIRGIQHHVTSYAIDELSKDPVGGQKKM